VRERGFTLVELMFVLGVLAFVSLGLATGVTTGHRTTQALEQQSLLVHQAQSYLERLFVLPFGAQTANAATGDQLTELFDEDDDYGTATLHSLRVFGAAEFQPEDFPVPGLFRVVVDADANGDGDTTDPFEGRADLLRIAVFHEGRLLAETLRFDPAG
jgi:prepilin-type N-terminal cleavage/methylation domain-containing protein